jgi:hypothetical protein
MVDELIIVAVMWGIILGAGAFWMGILWLIATLAA